jgi:carboxypeptidase PM20D1
MLRTTTAPTMLSASVKVNVLPIEAVATVNFRVHPRDSVEDVVNHVRRVVEQENVEVRVPEGGGRPASRVSDWQSIGFEVIERSVREIYGEVVVTPGLMIAGSDTRHYGKVADNAFRFNPMMVQQEDITGFHGSNEKISITNLAQGVRTYMQIITNGTSPVPGYGTGSTP